MSQSGYRVYILGAGCSADYGYPLAKDFVEDLKTFRNELDEDSVQLRQAADETIDLMEKSRSPTIDRLLRIIDEDWHEPDRSLRPYDPSRPPYCRIEGGPFEIPRKHEEQVDRITTNAKVATAALWLQKEPCVHESDLRGYHELFETIFPNLNWREALTEARCHVLTFNYDRLFEMAFLRRYPQFEHFFGVPVREPGVRINDTHFFPKPQTHSSRRTLKADPLIVFPHEKKDARPESGTKPLYREYISKAMRLRLAVRLPATNTPNCGFKAATENSAKPGATATTRSHREVMVGRQKRSHCAALSALIGFRRDKPGLA